MKLSEMNPVLKAVLTGLFCVVVILAISYIKDVVIDHGTFTPSWIEVIIVSVAVGFIEYFGPDAAQRKRNRENLKNKFTGKQ